MALRLFEVKNNATLVYQVLSINIPTAAMPRSVGVEKSESIKGEYIASIHAKILGFKMAMSIPSMNPDLPVEDDESLVFFLSREKALRA